MKYLLLLCCVISTSASAQLWQENNREHKAEDFDIHANSYRLFDFDASYIPENKQKFLTLALPMPDGKLLDFSVYQVSIMADELAKKFPQIQTYRGFSANGQSLVLDISPQGLHAVINFQEGSSVWIDPINKNNAKTHISYYQNSAQNRHKAWQCNSKDWKESKARQSLRGPSPLPINELQLKTYRLAVAATAEYTSFHSAGNATVAEGMFAIVTAMNRVNGVYEKEVGIRMILVANNDQIVFTDTATDGYSNSDGFAMLGENQAIIDSVIGSGNYDIGHVFSTGGGGIAALQSPCDNARKAQGVTGLFSPINDVFYIDYVAHEIGHQWGGRHIFNTLSGSCNGNRSGSAAVEPGSGSTIMGYAGICSPDNLQNNSDAYFNSHSLEEIINYSTTGNGASCATAVVTTNQAPLVNAGADYTLPKSTAFTLCATASDDDETNMTFNWEQNDLGPAGNSDAPVGNAPIFRSFNASSNNCRTFPKLSDVLSNTQSNGEVMASYARGLNFRVTVRDNEATGGGINTDDVQLTITDSGPFRISSHNSTQALVSSGTFTMTWDVANTTMAPVNCTSLDLSFSTDGGQNFSLISNGIANNGTATFATPATNSNQIRFKLSCSNNIFFDINDANLFVVPDLIFANGFE